MVSVMDDPTIMRTETSQVIVEEVKKEEEHDIDDLINRFKSF